ncbi:uncharacterized protein zbbx [Kryptolebias marmoratus]|uniref:uncharacterized protein zbbx n=1 Tax=Kryptolebias marmoratus TaxID=37003 RepID=UPI0018ACCAE5|nr:uncharacterized protein zbbx [Kryptolebias marmoratus]
MGEKPLPQEKRSMKLNDFVLLNNKARSVKLSARNLQELQMGTVALATESKDMEEKLQQLRDNMSKEKVERGHSRQLRWAFGQSVSSNNNFLPNDFKKSKDNKIQKLSAGKVKIRVLKDESLTAPPQLQPSPSVPHAGLGTRGKQKEICGQCGVKPAGFMCSEGTENHCTDCFSRCHQKGTLKLHSAIPIQVLLGEDGQEEKVGVTKDGKEGLGSSLLSGEYSEEESARSFQEALMQWREEERDGGGQLIPLCRTWKPVRPVLVSASATQADLPPDREAEGQRGEGAEEKLTIKIAFTGNSLTYMDRLLLKKHRRTPIESHHPSLDLGIDVKSLTITDTEEEPTSSLTAEEEDFRHYCASLFAVPVSRSRTESRISTPESFLVIEVLDEETLTKTCRNIKRVCDAEQKTENREVSTIQQIFRKEQSPMSHTALFSGFFKADDSSPSTQPSKHSVTSRRFLPAQKFHSADRQTPKPEQSVKDLSSKSKASACPLSETPGRSKESVKTPTSQSSRSNSSYSVHKPKAKCGSPQFLSPLPHSQSEIPTSSQSPVLPFANLSTLDSNISKIPKKHLSLSSSASFSLRSTFRVSPSSSTQSNLLPKVYHSLPQQKGADSSVLSENLQSSQLFAETISSLELCEAPTGNLFSPQQSQHSLSDLKLLRQPLSPVSARPQPPPKSLKPVQSGNNPMQYHGAACTYSMSALKFEDVIDNLEKMEEDKELLVDSADEMSTDSLSLAPHEDDSSGDEAQTQGRLTKKKSTEREDSAAVSHLEDFFVPAEAEIETDLQTDKPEHQSEPLMVMQHQSAGPGSEQFCDLDEFSPLGLDTDTSHSNSPEYESGDRSHSCQYSVHYPDATVSNSCSSRSLRSCAGEHLAPKEMKDSYTQPMGIQTHSTRREEMSANELRTSEVRSNLSETSTSVLTDSPRRKSRLTSASASHWVSYSPSPSLPTHLSHHTLGSGNSPSFRPHSSAAQEILEICNVDQTGCEDPDMDSETTKHMLHSLEQELKLTANTQSTCTNVMDRGNSEIQNQHGKYHESLTWGGVGEEQNEEEETAEGDRQSVLLLP